MGHNIGVTTATQKVVRLPCSGILRGGAPGEGGRISAAKVGDRGNRKRLSGFKRSGNRKTVSIGPHSSVR